MKSASPGRAHTSVPATIAARRYASKGVVSPMNAEVLPLITVSFCLIVLLMAGTGESPAAAESPAKASGSDDIIRSVFVSAPPKRVISLAPSLTEIMFDLGAGHLLVGRTALCNHPPEAMRIRDVGGYLNPDFERILALKPDLVLSPEMGMRREIVERLTELGIPVFVDRSNTLEEITHLIGKLGSVLGKEAEAQDLIKQFRRRRKAVVDRVASLNKPTVLFCVGLDPLVVSGGKSFIGSLIREAGGVNLAEDAAIPYPKFSIEEVVRNDPDVIVVLNKECRNEECFSRWQRHQGLKAVRNGLVYQLDADLVARPAPKIMDALERLAAILHPKIFGGSLSAGVHKNK